MGTGFTAAEISTVNLYNAAAEHYCQLYEAVAFEELYSPFLDLLPPPPAYTLDIGAGSGRDAAALAKKGYFVVAVEPSLEMQKQAILLHDDTEIEWIDDSLPKLPKIRAKARKFAFILVSAVWMHLAAKDRAPAFNSLVQCLENSGILLLTLRNGDPVPERIIYSVSKEEVYQLGEQHGVELIREGDSEDRFGRTHVTWTTLAFRKKGPLIK